MHNKKVISAIAIFLAALMLITVLVSAIGSGVLAASQADIDALEKQREAVRNEKNAVQSNINELSGQKNSEMEKKQAIDEQIALTLEEIDIINKQIDIYSQMIDQKSRDLEKAKEQESEQYESYKMRVRAMEENGNLSYLSIIFKSGSLPQLLTNLDMVGEIISSDKRLFEQYKAAREKAEEIKAEYEDIAEALKGKEAELQEQKLKLDEELKVAAEIIAGIQADIDEYLAVYNRKLQEEQALSAQINAIVAQLRAEEEARRRAEAAAAAGNTGGGGGGGSGGGGASATGSYMWPIPSSTLVTSRYGDRVHPITGVVTFHAGIDINASLGAAIVAADGGTVGVAGYNSGYGNYIMIYHANGNATLYAHLSSMSVQTGDTVSKGQVIGGAGATGWATGTHLHFEIRVNGGTVDPLGYFSGLSFYNC